MYSHQYRSLLAVHQDLAVLILPFVPKKKKKKIHKHTIVTDIRHISIIQIIENSLVDQGVQGVLYLPEETEMCYFFNDSHV